MLQPVVQAVCICDCIYNPLLMLFVCWSGVYSCWAIEWRMRQVGQTIRTGETRNKHTFVIRKLLGLGPQYTHIRTHIYTHTHTHTYQRTASKRMHPALQKTTGVLQIGQRPIGFRRNPVNSEAITLCFIINNPVHINSVLNVYKLSKFTKPSGTAGPNRNERLRG